MDKQVAVEVSGIAFAAAHFVSEGGKCERLHGHNYQITVTIYGEPNPQGMVIDFREIKQRVRKLSKEWDHRILLPAQSQIIKVNEKGNQTEVKTTGGTYNFPVNDVKVLAVVETTAEELARILCQKIIADLIQDNPNITQVRVSLEESPTSRAIVIMTV